MKECCKYWQTIGLTGRIHGTLTYIIIQHCPECGEKISTEPIRYPTHKCDKDALNEGLTTSFVLKRKKVYCSDCEWFSHLLFKTTGNGYVYPVDEKDCVHPDNCGTWELKDQSNLHPSEINTKNDCSWFTVKLDGRN